MSKALLVIALATFGLAACGDEHGTTTAAATPTQAATATASATPTPTPPGLVTYRLTQESAIDWQLTPDGPHVMGPLWGTFNVVPTSKTSANPIFALTMTSLEFQGGLRLIC
jgi:hypothetical protein